MGAYDYYWLLRNCTDLNDLRPCFDYCLLLTISDYYRMNTPQCTPHFAYLILPSYLPIMSFSRGHILEHGPESVKRGAFKPLPKDYDCQRYQGPFPPYFQALVAPVLTKHYFPLYSLLYPRLVLMIRTL